MKILALDSTAKICTAALCEGEALIGKYTEDNGLTHSSSLLPMIERLFSEAGIKAENVELYAYSAGPGSFTGVRIGAATVKGLCFGRNVPCVGVSALEALAYNRRADDGVVLAAMDARRSQVYAAFFRVGCGHVTRLSPDEALSLSELCERAEVFRGEPIAVVGDGASLAYDALCRADFAGAWLDEKKAGQDAYSVALCALGHFRAGECITDDRGVRPTYLRLPSAERERNERLAARSRDRDVQK